MKSDLSFLEEFRSKDPNPIIDMILPKGPGKGLFVIPVTNGMHLRVTSNVGKNPDCSPETDHICVSVREDNMGSSVRLPNEEELEEVKKMFWDEDELEQIFNYDTKIKPFGDNNTVHLQKRKNNWEIK